MLQIFFPIARRVLKAGCKHFSILKSQKVSFEIFFYSYNKEKFIPLFTNKAFHIPYFIVKLLSTKEV
jgi:hypothetical protein